MKFLNLIFLLMILSSGSVARNSCNNFFKNKEQKHSIQAKKQDSKFEKYLSGSLREGSNALTAEWLKVVQSILKMDTKKFQKFFATEYGQDVAKSIKAFSKGFAEVTTSRKSVVTSTPIF